MTPKLLALAKVCSALKIFVTSRGICQNVGVSSEKVNIFPFWKKNGARTKINPEFKGYKKKVDEVKELSNQAVTNAGAVHRERRKFLRSAIREMALLCADQPGLLGPKALFIFMGLCFCRDEVRRNVPQK